MARILYFGRLGDVAGASEERLALPEGVRDTGALRAWLDEARGFGGALLEKTVRVAVNDEILPGEAQVSDDDTVAFLPPVGGG